MSENTREAHKIYQMSLSEIYYFCEELFQIDQIKNMSDLIDFFRQSTTKNLWLKEIRSIFEKVPFAATKADNIAWITDHIEITDFQSKPVPPETPAPPPAPAKPVKLTMSSLNEFFAVVSPEYLRDVSDDLDISDGRITEQLPVTYQDDFLLQYRPGYCEKVVAVAKWSENRIIAFGSLQQDGNQYHILLPAENIDFAAFENSQKYRLVLFPATLSDLVAEGLDGDAGIGFSEELDIVACTIKYNGLSVTRNTLCIDFGTSNTSAGSYGLRNPEENETELVSFTDVTSKNMEESKLYPTMVYVEDCRDPQRIQYLFGYAAKKRLDEMGYDTDASVYFEIKRWIGALDDEEEIHDGEGHSLRVTRRSIVKAYLMHVIALSQQYFKVKFKTLHISAPVKLKVKSYIELRKMLEPEGYNLLPPANSVDEGIAIVYDVISTLVSRHKIGEAEPTKIMILDCGGGTTDLASCVVTAKVLDVGMKLDIQTKFMNGDSNFGGNNITFRILQLLKIKLAADFAPEQMGSCSLKELIPLDESEVLEKVEEVHQNRGTVQNAEEALSVETAIFAKFDEAFRKAEDIIPTIHVDNKTFRFNRELKKIRRNYYYLWQLAERIKLRFYEEDAVQVGFGRQGDRPLFVDTSNYYLYRNTDGKLERVNDPGNHVEITINEIRRVLCGDIYGLLHDLLTQKDLNVNDYKYYKLAGQSCRVTLFQELLKEFIPGRRLRPNSDLKEEIRKGGLKLNCIKGSIAYIRDKECGVIKPEISTQAAQLIYDVYDPRRIGEDKGHMLASEGENASEIGLTKYSEKANRAELMVANASGRKERKIVINFPPPETAKCADLVEVFSDVLRNGSFFPEDADGQKAITKASVNRLKSRIENLIPTDSDKVMLVFAVPSAEGYGMNIYCLVKILQDGKHIYRYYPPTYENYENESTKTFFDGRR